MPLLTVTAVLLLPLAALHADGEPTALATIAQRERAVLEAAARDFDRLNGNSPMHYWVAQRLFEQGQKDQALTIVRQGVKQMRAFIEKREAAKHENIGANGFLYWASLNCYVHWYQQFDQQLLDDYRYVFTHAKNYKGTTSNLSMIHTLALYLADRIWGAENLPPDGNYGARGPQAVIWLEQRIEHIAKFGSGEFASRPYVIYNVGTLLTLDNEFVDESLRKKAAMAYEMSVAHAAGTWLRGHWAVPSGRSYPDQLTQQPNGSAALLWTYVLGFIPGGARAVRDESRSRGQLLFHYGSVLIGLTATPPFEWGAEAGVLSGARRANDSEFRIRGRNVAVGLETALPGDSPGEKPDAQLAAFRDAVEKNSRLTIAEKSPGADATATFMDHDGVTIERTFHGDTRVNGERVAYETWPLLENPWMRQEFGGNLTLTDGRTTRVYDVQNWTITETVQPSWVQGTTSTGLNSVTAFIT